MAVDNRLTGEQLAALAPGDSVTIECGVDFARRRYTTGTVARLTARHVLVRRGRYTECYGLRNGVREGGLGRAELVRSQPHIDDQAQRRARQIDLLYRDWTRNRTDLERLRRVQAAIGELFEESTTGVHSGRGLGHPPV